MKTSVQHHLSPTHIHRIDSDGNKVKKNILNLKIEKRLLKILDKTLEGCQIVDFNYRYIYMNDVVARQSRRLKSEIIGKTLMETIPGIEKTELFARLRESLEQRKSQKMENEFTYPDGQKTWFEVRMEPIKEGVLIFSFDITERKNTERKNHTNNEKYQKILENLKDIVHIIDPQGKIIYVTPSIIRVLGYTPEEFINSDAKKYVHPDDRKMVYEKFQEVLRYPYTLSKPIEERILHKDGDYRTMEVVGINLLETPGIEGIVITSRDITERKKAEESIRCRTRELERLNKYQDETNSAMLNVMEDLEEVKTQLEIGKAKDEAMFTSIGEGFIAIDKNEKIMIFNKAAEDILGWRMKKMIGQSLTNFSLEDDAGHPIPLEKHPFQVAISSGKTISRIFFYTGKEKTKLPLAITVTPIKLVGKKIGAIIIFRDVTHEREIDRAKSEFVSLASHQLRTPLGIIKWYLEALKKNDEFSKSSMVVKKYFDEISKNNERVLNLVRDLLSVSRIEQGRVKNTPRVVDIISEIKEIVKQSQIDARKKKVVLQVTFQNKQIPFINIDKLRFREVIVNLIDNAITYTTTYGSIRVIVNKVDDNLLITIKDTGIGISTVDQKKLFTKFFRSERAIEYNPEGSGLGLYVVKSYVEGWDGSISVKSREGNGTTFLIHIPITGKNRRELVSPKANSQ